MNSLLGFMMLFFAISCSTVLWKEHEEGTRGLSSTASVQEFSVSHLSCFEGREREIQRDELVEFFMIDQHAQVGIGLKTIEHFYGDDCQRQRLQLDFYDRVVAIDDTTDKIILRTIQGRLIVVNSNGIKTYDLDFPVSGFEIVGQTLHLYNAKTAGRFCDYYQLKLPSDQRDSSCQLIAKKLNL